MRLIISGSIIFCIISDVDLHHSDDGNDRWLVTSGLDRRVKFFDLTRLPLEVMCTVSKSRCISGVWPLNWGVFLSVCDESSFLCGCSFLQYITLKLIGYFSGQSGCNAIGPIGFGNLVTIMSQLAGNAMDMQFNDWLNAYIIVSDYGDIRISVCHQLVGMFADKFTRGRAVSDLFFAT